jgi:NTE family protein
MGRPADVLSASLVLALMASGVLAQQPDAAPRRPRVGVVLSGGGGRGGAHLGALRELEQAGVPIDLVVGTSYGALVGGLYCAGYSIDDMELILQTIDWNALLSNTSRREYLDVHEKIRASRKLVDLQFENFTLNLPIGLQGGQKIQQLLDRLTAHIVLQAEGDFDRLPIPFRAVATDVLTGRPHVFRRGWLSTAIRASGAIPGLFTPVRFEKALLIDGGLVDNVPADIAREAGADIVIAIDVTSPSKTRYEEFKSLIDVLSQVIGFQVLDNSERGRQNADLVISPSLEGVGAMSFADALSLVAPGAEAVRSRMPEIRRVLAAKNLMPGTAKGRRGFLDRDTFDWERFAYSPSPIVLKDVRVEGLRQYPPSVVLDRLSTKPGAPASPGSIDRDVSILYGTDLFLEVTYRLESENGETILTFDLTEKAPVRLGLGLRYDQDYQLSGMVDLLMRRFTGSRSDLFIRGLVGNAKNFELGLDREALNRLTLSASIQYFSQPRALYSGKSRIGDYQDQRYAAHASLHYRLTNAVRLQFAYTAEKVYVERGAAVTGQQSPSSLARLRGGMEIDTLDDYDFPTSGFRGNAFLDRYERVVGSDRAFGRAAGSYQHYVSFGPDYTLGLSGRGGHLDGETPFVERFYIGGVQPFGFSSARFIGLSRDEIAARDFVMAGVLLRYRVKRFQSGTVRGVHMSASYDTGIFARDGRLLREGDRIHGVGLSLFLDVRYLGPVRFEIGRAQAGDPTAYFSIGRAF